METIKILQSASINSTQREVANKLGVHESQLSRWINTGKISKVWQNIIKEKLG